MNEIEEAIHDLDEDIKELQDRKAFLEQLDLVKIPTEDEWHEMCLSPLRSSDILAVFVKNIFPDAEDIKIGCNYAKFNLYGITCMLPTSALRGIEIDTSWFVRLKEPTMDDLEYLSGRYRKLKSYIEATDWDSKTQFIMGSYYKKWYRFLAWNFKYKFLSDKYEAEYKELNEKNQENFDKRHKSYEEKLAEQTEKCIIIRDKVIPELLKFTDKICPSSVNNYSITKTIDDVLDYYLKEAK